ncbi:MAG: anti-sigma factor antagonist [Clostridiales bacterium]|nr:anti-sigma factor antagonist [Clostridiales bacterium]MCD7828109.1 anti-sigma factor antagonist [Clostridiales bacterium]
MSILFKSSGDMLTVYLSGDIDHHTSKELREHIDGEIQKRMPKILRLDFHDVQFMDSSGVGLVMGRCKTAGVYGCQVIVSHMPPNVARIMKMSGIGRIVLFEE